MPVSGCLGFQQPADSRDKTEGWLPMGFYKFLRNPEGFYLSLPVMICMHTLSSHIYGGPWPTRLEEWGRWLPLTYCSLLLSWSARAYLLSVPRACHAHSSPQAFARGALTPRYAHGSLFTRGAFSDHACTGSPLSEISCPLLRLVFLHKPSSRLAIMYFLIYFCLLH